jgi:tetratricopeptide (TPR) repeat protein
MNEPGDPNSIADFASAPIDSLDAGLAAGFTRQAEAPAGGLPAVPGYRVLREIARGGMGKVLAAHDLSLERDVALKVLLPGANADRFVRESKITARLPHPGIPPVHALGTLASGAPFLAMKLIAGQTLADELKTADRPRLLQAFTQVCQAVGFAHSRGVIHRDLKPANVMVGAFGEVQVMDWGLAKNLTGRAGAGEPRPSPVPAEPAGGAGAGETVDDVVPGESTDDPTQAGTVMGTPAYMAPEQARGEATDARADVFALGGMLCAILTGQPPYRGESARQVMQRAAAADLADAHARLDRCGADAELLALCRRCLSPDAADRPADGRAVADAMTAYGNGVQERLRAAEVARAAAAARAEEATERIKAERRTRHVQLVAASLVLVVLAGGVVGTAFGLVQARRAKGRAETAEGEARQRADELQKVADYQARMLQLDPAEAGVRLMADVRARHAAALEKAQVPAPERSARAAALEHELHAVNATDAAVTMLDQAVLAPAVRAIDAQFADQPLVDAALRTTLGTVYGKLGRPVEALALHQRAHGLRKELLGEDHPDTLASSLAVGAALGKLQKLTEADGTIRATLRNYERVLGEDHTATLDAKAILAEQLELEGKYEDCEALARDILERRRRVGGPDRADTLGAMTDLGRYLMNRGKYADAVTALRDAAEAQRRVADPALAATLTNLGQTLTRQREYAAAEPYLREALDRRRRDLGDDHPLTVGNASTLASLLTNRGKLPEAEALANEALGKSRRLYGDEHAETLKAMTVTAQALLGQNKLADAEPLCREALATGRRVLGEDHPDVIVWTANLGHLLWWTGRSAEAEPYCREALDRNRRRLGEAHPYTVALRRKLVNVLRDQGKLAEAEECVRGALEAVRRRDGEDHPEALSLTGLLAATLHDQGKSAEAEQYYRQAIEKYRRLRGEGHADTVSAVLRLADMQVNDGRYAEALALLGPLDGEKVRRAFSDPNLGLVRRASLLGLLGRARAGLAKSPAEFAAVEAHLLEAQSVFAKLLGEKDKETPRLARSLVDLYTAWDKAEPGKGYDAKAAEWKAKLGGK